ncbi:MAG: tyrosine--tRNA ligase [Pseudomonadota bacterium]
MTIVREFWGVNVPLLEELDARGLVVQATDREALSAFLVTRPQTIYCGFDPSADSLHVGNLVPLLALRRLQLAGHRPVLLLGGATGLIGDPSGKSEERNLKARELVEHFVQKLRLQVSRFLDFDGANGAQIVNNIDWTERLSVIDYLRDVGKHFSVNRMMERDSVKTRLEREEQGISYTEFSYMVLQALDFLELARSESCLMQIGGSDQWGNMVSGADLIRRELKREAHVLTLPLITKADGTKFGKSADGAIWLDAAKTSPYAFYQFWLNAADEDLDQFFRYFTFLPLSEVAALLTAHAAEPGKRTAQRRLAEVMTALVHGDEALAAAQRISEALFSGGLAALTETDIESLERDGMASTRLPREPIGMLAALVQAGLAASNGAARKLVQSGGVMVNGSRLDDPSAELHFSDALFGRFFLLRRGKKQWHLIVGES